jgi:hypothetical protein
MIRHTIVNKSYFVYKINVRFIKQCLKKRAI